MINEYSITWKLYRSWVKETMFKGVYLVFLIIWSIFGLGSLALYFMSEYQAIFLLTTLWSVYMGWLRSFVHGRRQYRTLSKINGTRDWTRTISFEEDNILVKEENANLAYLPYHPLPM